MRISIGSFGLVAVATSLAFGCSAILGIDNLPSPSDAGAGSGSSGSSASSSGGSTSSGGVASSGVTASGVGVTSSGVSSGGVASSGVTASGVGVTSSGVTTSSGDSGSTTGSSGGHGSDVSAFLGAWQTVDGTQELNNCSNPAANQKGAVPTTIILTFTAGTTSDLIGTYSGLNSSGCTFLANVSGSTATAPSGQMCTETSTTETDIVTLSSYSFAITGGNAADEAAAGTVVDQTNPASCTISSSTAYSKM